MTATAPTRSPRTLGLSCAGLLASAAVLWGASVAVWFRVGASGQRVVDVTGAQARPALGGVALLALAGVAAVLATSGILRRAVGGLLGVAGAAIGGAGVLALAVPSAVGPLPEPPAGTATDALVAYPAQATPAPLLAVLGGLLLLAVGLVVLVREGRLPRFGARYAAPGSRPPADPDRTAWQDLDAGLDPTDPDRPVDPDGGASRRAG